MSKKQKIFYCPIDHSQMVDTGCENFKCPKCGIEGVTYMGKLDFSGYSYDYDFVYEKPYGCSGCGGNYPQCRDSCSRYDD